MQKLATQSYKNVEGNRLKIVCRMVDELCWALATLFSQVRQGGNAAKANNEGDEAGLGILYKLIIVALSLTF